MSITAEKLQQAGYKITPNNNYIKQNTGVYITWTFENGDEFTQIPHSDEITSEIFTTDVINQTIDYLKADIVNYTQRQLNALELLNMSKGNVTHCEIGVIELFILFKPDENGSYVKSGISQGKKVKYHEFSLKCEREVKVTVEVVD